MSIEKVVVVSLGDGYYGFPIEEVDRILPVQKLTPVPKSGKELLGLFDLRGTMVPTIDLHRLLELDAGASCDNFVVVLTEQGRCAVQVESVVGIITLKEDQIEPMESVVRASGDYFLGIGKDQGRLVVLLDPNKLVPSNVQKKAEKAASKLQLAA